MATYFVTQGHDETPRWKEAFPDARLIRPDDLDARLVRGDCVWVMADVPGWPERVGELQRRGAAVGVMTYAPGVAEAFQALESGARAYVHTLSPPELLRQARLVILNQGIWVPPELMARVVGGVFHALGSDPLDRAEILAPLTERERAVALAVVEGYSNKEVARRLDITERTVKAHLGSVFRKLGIRDRMQLVLRLTSRQDVAIDPSQ